MARGRIDDFERREWNRMSHLLAMVAAVGGSKKPKPSDFNPYGQQAEVEGPKEHVSVLKDLFGGGRNIDG
jgi:hypothetical protein